MSMFATPGAPGGDTIDYNTVNGRLLLFEVVGLETGIVTVHGPSDAVRANVTVLDGANKGTKFNDVLVFPRVLRGQLASKAGQLVLGRLGQGTPKAGQSAPWILNPATPDDVATGEAWMRQQQSSSFAQPGAQAPF